MTSYHVSLNFGSIYDKITSSLWEGGNIMTINPAMFGIYTPFHLP